MDKALLAGKNLRRLIKENKQTQQTFADDYGTDLRNVSRWINERKLTNIDTIQELADYFEFFKEI